MNFLAVRWQRVCSKGNSCFKSIMRKSFIQLLYVKSIWVRCGTSPLADWAKNGSNIATMNDNSSSFDFHHTAPRKCSQIAKFTGPTWGPPGSCRPQMGPMLVPWTLLSGLWMSYSAQHNSKFTYLSYKMICYSVVRYYMHTYYSISF